MRNQTIKKGGKTHPYKPNAVLGHISNGVAMVEDPNQDGALRADHCLSIKHTHTQSLAVAMNGLPVSAVPETAHVVLSK